MAVMTTCLLILAALHGLKSLIQNPRVHLSQASAESTSR